MKFLRCLLGFFLIIDCHSFTFWDFLQVYVDGKPVDYVFDINDSNTRWIEKLSNSHCTLLQDEPRGNGRIRENPLNIDLEGVYDSPELCRANIRGSLKAKLRIAPYSDSFTGRIIEISTYGEGENIIGFEIVPVFENGEEDEEHTLHISLYKINPEGDSHAIVSEVVQLTNALKRGHHFNRVILFSIDRNIFRW